MPPGGGCRLQRAWTNSPAATRRLLRRPGCRAARPACAPAGRAGAVRPRPVPRRLGRAAGRAAKPRARPPDRPGGPRPRRRSMRIAMVSEHASPLATLGGVDAGGQNVHVAALATALARRGHDVTRLHPAGRRRPARPGDHAPRRGRRARRRPGRRAPRPKDELLPYMGAFADGHRADWAEWPPDVVHAHFWMSGLAASTRPRPPASAAGRADVPRARRGQAAPPGRRGHQPGGTQRAGDRASAAASTGSSRPAPTRCSSWPGIGLPPTDLRSCPAAST